MKSQEKLLFTESDWDFRSIKRTYSAIEEIALGDLGLDIYPNQIEIISSEQMLDAYASNGLPLMYQHWSFGKHFISQETLYRKGYTSLAYEIVINSNPCISYNMEENSMPMQTLVMAHAAFGHNHFFKNNYLFQQWTDAGGILDYLKFAKDYMADCEEKHGREAVEEILDAAHAIMQQSVFRHPRHPKLSKDEGKRREQERLRYEEETYNDLWRTLPRTAAPADEDEIAQEFAKRKKALKLPEENLLYFIEKNSVKLESWEREILRIVRYIAQYLYPQRQTKIMNEGCACFVHHYIVNELYNRGLITEGALMEILHSHTNVVMQPGFDDPRFSGINPYALGFSMMQDIKRIVIDPTEEDREWFPEIAGTQDWRSVLKDAWANHRDESFIRQFLSPKLMRTWRLFQLHDRASENYYSVAAIHNEQGYERLRSVFAESNDITSLEPDLQITDVDLQGDRELVLGHTVRNGVTLADRTRKRVLSYVRRLWGYDVTLKGIDQRTGETLYEVRTGKE